MYTYYVYILIISVWGWCALVVAKGDIGVLTYYTLPHSLESDYLSEPRSRLTVSKLQSFSCLCQPPPVSGLELQGYV